MVVGKGINDIPNSTINYHREYRLWSDMLHRCYDERIHITHPSYKECEVDERWLLFSNFLEDIKTLKNYDKWVLEGGKKWNLDKDYSGTKIYSVKTCIFTDTNCAECNVRNEKYKKCAEVRSQEIQVIWLDGRVEKYSSSSEFARIMGVNRSCVHKWIYNQSKGYLQRGIKSIEMFPCYKK